MASAGSLILLQMGARILSFALNQLLVRLVSPNVYGAAAIQLELLLSTILFLSRDAIRTVLARKSETHTEARSKQGLSVKDGSFRQEVHNISLLPIPIGIVLSIAVAYSYIKYLSPLSLRDAATFRLSVALYVLGALAELVFEPLHIRALGLGNASLRVKAEGAGTLAKCLFSVIGVVLAPALMQRGWLPGAQDQDRSVGLVAFGLGQLFNGLAMLIAYAGWFLAKFGWSQTVSLYVPSSSGASAPLLDRATLAICWAMTKQGVLKHLLTEGDKFAIAKFASLEDQGGYALASNYGSLVARILFSPIEDTVRLLFSQHLPSLDPSQSPNVIEIDLSQNGRVTQKSAPTSASTASLDSLSQLLSTLFRSHLLLGALFVTFGAPLSVAFLYIMAGPRWALTTNAPAILGTYTWYIPVMGINGITEGFLQSTASKQQLERYSLVLIGASCYFGGSLWLSSHLTSGETGIGSDLVTANAMSLFIRAAYCWAFLVKYFTFAAEQAKAPPEIVARVRPTTAIPSRPVLAVFGVVFVALRLVATRLMPSKDMLLAAAARSGLRRLEAVRTLVPVLSAGVACLAVCLAAW